MTDIQSVLEILKTEDIRYFDGRYRDGFVDQADLAALIEAGQAEVYWRGDPSSYGARFVRLAGKAKEAGRAVDIDT